MKIILATSNQGKIKELKKLMPNDEVIAFSNIIEPFEIIEDGDTFAKNAVIKVKAVNAKLKDVMDEDYIVISDDSGISIEALNFEPNIFSARYAGIDASDVDNLNKVIENLKAKNLKESNAFYTCAIAVMFKDEVYTVHGWMHGKVLDEAKGTEGFGYDPIFVPIGFKETLGQLDHEIKKKFSHRGQALRLAQKLIKVLVS
jgi:XTP/dITP diphosphohydrolase